ncbi:hypothetical protein K435DRAFT_805547 [Dendrothele bispora CBS 962.96]|uniref:Uncharacterized protein n=1 Tax=Dendrothele bispora (strain CBS 962.96) TaxID=1314807 RepID=A0A4S8LAR4_DENBC|nr:hypothetical protein K435DRAFT_805547 [Dendrothele bispora CBS 962.96]
MADNLKFSRTEHDHVELASQDVAVQPRSLSPAILASPLLQIATRFSLQPIPEDLAPFLEQREDPNNWCHRADAKTGLEDQRLQVANECNLARTEHDHAKPLDRHAATSRLVFPTLFAPFPWPLGYEDLAPSLWEQGKPTPDLNYGASSKTGEEVELVGEREEGMRSVHDSRAQISEHYEYKRRNTSLAVPLGRGQNTLVPNAPMTVVGSELLYQHPHTRTQPSRGQDEQEVQHLVPLTAITHQSKTPQPLVYHQEQPVVHSPPPISYASRLSRPSPFIGTTSTQGSVSWRQLRDFVTPVRHIVRGFGGGGDPEGSSYGSSESDYGGRNGGGGRPPGWGDDDPGNPDHNDGGQSDDHQPRRGRRGDNEPRRGPCGGGPLGGDPPDDGEPEGGRYGNSKRSNRKDSKKRRGVTPFSEIPEEGSPHYGYEYFEYKGEPPTSFKRPLKEKVFIRLATLIEWRLFTKMQVMRDSKAQRNLINSIPKIKQYNGQNSIIVLDNFLRGLIRHMEIQGLTGPEKREDSKGTLVVTNEDAGRTILMVGNLTGAALEWYQKYAEQPPDSFKQGMKASAHRRTFLQIFRALFDRFITGVALKEIGTLYDKARYTTLGGIRQLFSDMKMYAETMPVPPDEYRFKDNLLEKLPQSMRRIVLNDGLGPNTATIDEIMQRALAVESGWEAEAYYDTIGSQLNVSESETDTGGESESEETQEQGESEPEETQERGESGGCTDKRYAGDDQPDFKPVALRSVTSVHSIPTAPRRSKSTPTA